MTYDQAVKLARNGTPVYRPEWEDYVLFGNSTQLFIEDETGERRKYIENGIDKLAIDWKYKTCWK